MLRKESGFRHHESALLALRRSRVFSAFFDDEAVLFDGLVRVRGEVEHDVGGRRDAGEEVTDTRPHGVEVPIEFPRPMTEIGPLIGERKVAGFEHRR